MANLVKADVITDLKGLLKIPVERGDARLDTCLELALREIVPNFGEGIGVKTLLDQTITYQASPELLYISLPSDVLYTKSVMIGSTEVTPLSAEEYMKYRKSGASVLNQPYLGMPLVNADGTKIMELFPRIEAFSNETADIVYQSTGNDVTVIPEEYKKLILLCAAKNFVFWDSKNDVQLYGKFRSAFKEEMKSFNDYQVAMTGEERRIKTQLEHRWQNSFNDLIYRNSTDI